MAQKTNKVASGCLWLILVVLITIVAYACLVAFGINSGVVYFIVVLITSVLVKKMINKPEGGKPDKRNSYRVLFVALLVGGGFAFIYQLNEFTSQNPSPVFTEEEIVINDTLVEVDKKIPLLSSRRSWRDNVGKSYTATLSVRKEDHERLKDLSAKYSSYASGSTFWGDLYDFLETRSASSLDLLFETFKIIQEREGLNSMEFAQMVTSCIQDIPYALVFDSACLTPKDYTEQTIKDVLTDCPDCCIGYKAYGIQAPVEFLATLKGDCDSRTVLLYSVLKHFNYDVAILNSTEYRHSVLGLNLPASGTYKAHRGKRYYLWETTAKYFKIGQLAPTMDNVSYWDIVLLSK